MAANSTDLRCLKRVFAIIETLIAIPLLSMQTSRSMAGFNVVERFTPALVAEFSMGDG